MPLEQELQRAADIVRKGGVVIVATETFYGMAADPFQEHAVQRIFRIKGREESKPVPLIAADRSVAEKLASHVSSLARGLMDRFWPGSLTLLFEPAGALSGLITGTKGMVGIRVPPPCPALTLAARAGGVITATSANLTGEPNPQSVDMIGRSVLDRVDLVLDTGPTPGGMPSTLVLADEQGLTILRNGAVPAELLVAFADNSRGQSS